MHTEERHDGVCRVADEQHLAARRKQPFTPSFVPILHFAVFVAVYNEGMGPRNVIHRGKVSILIFVEVEENSALGRRRRRRRRRKQK